MNVLFGKTDGHFGLFIATTHHEVNIGVAWTERYEALEPAMGFDLPVHPDCANDAADDHGMGKRRNMRGKKAKMLRHETGFVPGAQRITRPVIVGYRHYRVYGKILKVPKLMAMALGRRKTYQLAKRAYRKGEWEAIITAANNRIRNAK